MKPYFVLFLLINEQFRLLGCESDTSLAYSENRDHHQNHPLSNESEQETRATNHGTDGPGHLDGVAPLSVRKAGHLQQ